MELTLLETIGLFIQLRNNEEKLDTRMLKLLNKLEKNIYTQLSIQEMENIEVYYKETI